MKIITKQFFVCSLCNSEYETMQDAEACETRKLISSGLKIGDKVQITKGDSNGCLATITGVYVCNKEWGHYAWDRYWHTERLSVDIDGTVFSRTLTFDDYKKV